MIKTNTSHWKIRICLDAYHTEIESIEADIRDEYLKPTIGKDMWDVLGERIEQLAEIFPNLREVRIVETGDPGLQNMKVYKRN